MPEDHLQSHPSSSQSAAALTLLYNVLPQPLWTFSENAGVQFVNHSWTAYTGLSPENSQGSGWLLAIHADDRATLMPRRDTGYELDLRIRRSDGEFRLHCTRIAPAGPVAPGLWVAIATEIPERFLKVAAESQDLASELKRRVEDFETLFRVLPIGVAVGEDPECHKIRVNPALAEILGVDADQNASRSAPGAASSYTFFRDGRELPLDELPQRIAGRTGEDVRGAGLEIVRTDGVTRYMFGNATPLFDDQGKVRGTVGAYLDLTDRHRSETVLREREVQLHSATQIAGMEIWSLRASDTWMFATERICEWFGIEPIELGQHGAAYFRRIHPEDTVRVRESFYGAFRDRVPCIAEFRTMPRPGETRWILSQGEIVQFPNGEERLLGVMMDITDRKRAEMDLLHSNTQLEQFAYAASHDLQEPLRTINIYTEFLIREFAAQKNARAELFSKTIRDGVARCSG